jgi:hypothetical protein
MMKELTLGGEIELLAANRCVGTALLGLVVVVGSKPSGLKVLHSSG